VTYNLSHLSAEFNLTRTAEAGAIRDNEQPIRPNRSDPFEHNLRRFWSIERNQYDRGFASGVFGSHH
jgi:hypothetical protein